VTYRGYLIVRWRYDETGRHSKSKSKSNIKTKQNNDPPWVWENWCDVSHSSSKTEVGTPRLLPSFFDIRIFLGPLDVSRCEILVLLLTSQEITVTTRKRPALRDTHTHSPPRRVITILPTTHSELQEHSPRRSSSIIHHWYCNLRLLLCQCVVVSSLIALSYIHLTARVRACACVRACVCYFLFVCFVFQTWHTPYRKCKNKKIDRRTRNRSNTRW